MSDAPITPQTQTPQQLSMVKESFSGLLTSLQSREELGYHDVAVLFAVVGTGSICEIKKIDLQLTEVKDNPFQDTNAIVTAAKNNLNEAEKELIVVGLASLSATEEQVERGATTYGFYVCKNLHKKDGTIDAFPKLRAYRMNASGQKESVMIQVTE